MNRSIILIFTFIVLSSLPAGAGQSSVPALNETALRENLASQFAQHPDMVGLKNNTLRIEAQHAIQVGNNTYYTVKIGLSDTHLNGAKLGFPMTFSTEPTGTLLFNSVINLRNGKEALLSQSPDVTQINFPASVTPSTFATGTGKSDVIFIADPFCPHCRKGYSFLSDRLNSIHRISLAHNPLIPSNGSAIAAWVMEYALKNDFRAWDVVKFSFSKLKPVSPLGEKGTRLSPKEVSMNILAQYKDQFPQLFEAVNGDLGSAYEILIKEHAQSQIEAHSQLIKAGFTFSPIFIIDGRVIKGMDKQILASALAGNQEISSKGTICGENTTGCSQ